jgi:hypothetical protein
MSSGDQSAKHGVAAAIGGQLLASYKGKLKDLLEPDETIQALARGVKSIFAFSPNFNREQLVVVTQRNVYFIEQKRLWGGAGNVLLGFLFSSLAGFAVSRKQAREGARLAIESRWLMLDGDRLMRVRPGRRRLAERAVEVVSGRPASTTT